MLEKIIFGGFSFRFKCFARRIAIYRCGESSDADYWRKVSSTDLAYYDRGQTYPSVAMRSIYDTVGSVLLPIFSREQNNTIELRQSAQKAIGFSFFLVAPCFIGFAAIAEPFTKLLLTDKWLPCVPYMRLFCVYQLGILPYCVLRNILYATGNSKNSLFQHAI